MKDRVEDDKKVAAELTLGMVTRVGSPHSVDDFGGHGLDTPDLVQNLVSQIRVTLRRKHNSRKCVYA